MPPLPKLIVSYFSLPADASVGELGTVLAETAVVRDERHSHQGLDAIRTWRIDTMSRTPFDVRPLSFEDRGDAVVVHAEVSGDFPGSPVLLDHRFKLSAGRITALEIA